MGLTSGQELPQRPGSREGSVGQAEGPAGAPRLLLRLAKLVLTAPSPLSANPGPGALNQEVVQRR